MENLLPLPLKDLVPRPEYFTHHSVIHGQPHVARVVFHTLLLVDRLGLDTCRSKAWAAAYIHDLGREHDGLCPWHGQYAVQKLQTLPQVKTLLEAGGVIAEDWEGIITAVENHCREELSTTHTHWEITAILKDADGLDRVRLGDLNPNMLRFPQSRLLIPFAQALHDETQRNLSPGPHYFDEFWPIAQRILSLCGGSHPET